MMNKVIEFRCEDNSSVCILVDCIESINDIKQGRKYKIMLNTRSGKSYMYHEAYNTKSEVNCEISHMLSSIYEDINYIDLN